MPDRIITPGVPVPGAPPPKMGGPVISAVDTTDYVLGRQNWTQGKALPPTSSWWQREGFAEAQANAPVLTLTVGSPPPPGQRYYAPFIAADKASYDDGYGANPASSPDNSDYFWRWGFRDRAAGIPKAAIPVGAPPPPLPAPPQPAATPTPAKSPYVELAVDLFGHPVLYTTAVSISQTGGGSLISIVLKALEHWRLLGDGPGDSREGYRLSGPNGPIARKVSRGIATGELNPDPRTYGLPVWVGTAVQTDAGRAVRLLSGGELDALGLRDQVWDRFGP